MNCPMLTLFFTGLSFMFLRGAWGWIAPDFCRGYECPEYTLVEKNEDFEQRAYATSRWITTDVSAEDLKGGFLRLYQYCTGKNEASAPVTTKTWPALISKTEVEGGEEQVSVSFFVPPGTMLPKPNDPSIREEIMSAGTVYVRIFTDSMSLSAGLANVKQLRDALRQAGKTFEPLRYIGAGYQNPWVLIHQHNEIWVHAA